MHYFRISGEVEERLLSPTHTHTHSHAQRERECESARVREREAERNTREPVHAFIERAHTFIQHSRMHKQHTFFPFQGRLKNACTALHAHTHAQAGRGRERGREAHTHTPSILRVTPQDCQSICAVLCDCQTDAERAHAHERIEGGFTIPTGKSCPWPAKKPLFSKVPDFRLGLTNNSPLASDIQLAAPNRGDHDECQGANHSQSVRR